MTEPTKNPEPLSDLLKATDQLLEQMQECEQQSLNGIFLRMMLKKAILAEMKYCVRRDTHDKNIWEWFYEAPRKAPYFLMRVKIEVGKVFRMNIDYNPELTVNNEL